MKIHFIGIGGIGLSAIARVLKSEGHIISGSDLHQTTLTNKLQKEGIEITIPHNSSAIKDQDLIIYSAVIKESNVERVEAKKRGIKTISRRETLKFFLGNKKVYSVCGAHGKSTTTAMLASVFKDANAIIGAESKEFGSNARVTNSECLVFEADESDGSFVDSHPYCAIVTNSEPEHMEYYNYDYDLFYNHYERFLSIAKCRVISEDDEYLNNLSMDSKKVSINNAKNIKYEIIDKNPKTTFEYKGHKFEVYGFGEHIVLDALMVIEAASFEMDLEEISNNLKNFKGIKKRFDILQNENSFVVIDDYAHHPTEIKATLHSAKTFAMLNGNDKIIAIWQPHKYSRTVDNLKEFIECFDGVDELIILPVWSAGEEKREIKFEALFKQYNLKFADKVKTENGKVSLLKNDEVFEEITGDLVIGFGAGDITYQLRG
jgi:UDP-N-acetylmuramate--alanine ligase